MERLSPADAWFLYLEGPTVQLHVTGLLLLDPSTAPEGFSFGSVRRHVAGRLAALPILRQRLVEVPLDIDHPGWVDDPDFELDRHLHHHLLEGDGSMAELAGFVGTFASAPLSHDRPLWDMVLIEGLEAGRAALVLKMHHCMVDGVSGMEVLAHLLDLSPTPGPGEPLPAPPSTPVPTGLAAAAEAGWSRISNPWRGFRAALGAFTTLGQMADTALRRRIGGSDTLAHPVNAPRTAFNASITPNRTVAFGRVPLEEIKAVKRAFDATVNDVVLAACTTGLRRYLAASGTVPERPLVCSVPVSTHREEAGSSANQVSNMFVNLPVQIDDPVERLRSINAGTRGAKEMQSSVGGDLIGNLVELVPGSLFRVATRLYSQAGLADRLAPVHNLVISNVVGSPFPLYLAGAHVTSMWPFGPLLEGAGLNITVVSNVDELDIGLIGCTETAPDLDLLLAAIIDGVDELTRSLP